MADYSLNTLKNKGENADGVDSVIRIPPLRVGSAVPPPPRRKRIVL
jgi:hypothetical protein